jgi:hypothetical protein
METTSIGAYKVVEDNGGGIHLIVYNTIGEAIYLHTGYQFSDDALANDLDALKAGDDPRDWDGNALYDAELIAAVRTTDDLGNTSTTGPVHDNDGDIIPLTTAEAEHAILLHHPENHVVYTDTGFAVPIDRLGVAGRDALARYM